MSDLISREKVKEILRTEWVKMFPMELDPYLSLAMEKIENIPSAEPNVCKETARTIATIIENEMDMRVILRNNDPDIVKVIRCKDCDRSQVDFDEHGEVTFRCRLYDPFIVCVKSDGLGFCSNAKRRD